MEADMEELQSVERLVEKLPVCYLSSVDTDGFPATRAMLAPRVREGIKVFYFSTNTTSLHVQQLLENPKACAYYCSEKYFEAVMFRGTVEVLDDQKHKDMVWREGDEYYYAGGATDPEYCVLRFTATSGRYYGNFVTTSFSLDEA